MELQLQPVPRLGIPLELLNFGALSPSSPACGFSACYDTIPVTLCVPTHLHFASGSVLVAFFLKPSPTFLPAFLCLGWCRYLEKRKFHENHVLFGLESEQELLELVDSGADPELASSWSLVRLALGDEGGGNGGVGKWRTGGTWRRRTKPEIVTRMSKRGPLV